MLDCLRYYMRRDSLTSRSGLSWIELVLPDTTVTTTGCWVYTGGSPHKGYRRVPGMLKDVHRLSGQTFLPNFESSLVVMHECDNRPCWRPSHLRMGTIAENQRDMARKGRSVRGERQHAHTLTEADVLNIRHSLAAGTPPSVLSKTFHTSPSNVRAIRVGRTWAYLGGPVSTTDGRFAWRGIVKWSKLTPRKVARIRALLARGVSQYEIARRFEIHQTQISNIARGKQWKQP